MEVKSLLQPKLYPEKYLSHFVKASWREIEKKSQLEWSWHLDSVCEAMQDVVNGKIKRLIINLLLEVFKVLLFPRVLSLGYGRQSLGLN